MLSQHRRREQAFAWTPRRVRGSNVSPWVVVRNKEGEAVGGAVTLHTITFVVSISRVEFSARGP